ncbi:MAG: hypothetical protein PHN84_14390 [Desulfuromonadaceae bacterium]|nr:hypothetical protein [Desulfuromonadaceae bacterium]MDD2855331.1 hypothetical protein [Desulfuromonadaceae bacterium]
MAPKIKILKPGMFTSASGRSYTFTPQDLQATAAAYNPALFAAGLVKGHPAHDEPRFGDLSAVEFDGSFLIGTPDNITPEFRNEVNDGRYPYVSLSLYDPNHPANPVPGTYYPRHLGFLGAAGPAVKGLGRVELSEDDVSIVIIDFSEDEEQTGKTGNDKEATAMTEEDLKVKEEALAKREQALNAREKSDRQKLNAAFAEGLVKEGKLLPAQKESVTALLDFSEGVHDETGPCFASDMTPHTVLQAFLSGLSKQIEFAEMAGGINPGKQPTVIPADLSRHI